MKKLLTLLAIASLALPTMAQRVTDKIDRGVIAVPSNTGSGNLVSWRVLGEEYYDVTYNLYRNGTKIASNLKASNYVDASGNSSSKYSVAPVVRGEEKSQSAQVQAWSSQRKYIQLVTPKDRDGNEVGDDYSVNDVSLGDVNGDGVVEFLVKRPCSKASDVTQSKEFHHLDCYDINGKLLWWIDLGPNMLAGADEQWDAVMYDWDEDGKAEVILRCEDNAYIHFSDGTSELIGSASVDTRWNGIEYTSTGNEYLLYLEGATGKPYQIGPSSHPDYMDYPNPRGTDSDWGTGIVGHRSTKHYFGAPFLDGRHASIFLGRGCYTKHMMKAFDVNPANHQLTQRWAWECSVSSSPWYGQGYHNFAIGDVDWDGRDEIIFGSMVIDDNGYGLSTTGLGHGDSQHCADFDPYRKYEEQFACNEDQPANNYRNAVTSELYYRQTASADDGRALMGNFSNSYPGSVGRSVNSGWVGSCSDKVISELGGDALINWADLNSRIYWDGDLCDEYMDSPGEAKAAVVYKPGTGSRLLAAGDGSLNNSSKNNPCAQADILGDWREELVLRGNNQLIIAATNYSTTYRIPTLWSDHQYRNAMVWQSVGYNQTPHKSYFLGEMEGITQAPPTNTMTDRKEIANGGTISTCDDHLIVCETNDTKINIADGAAPYMVTFDVPSWVQGTAASNTTTKSTPIKYTYYTCDVTGGALTGSMRLVKTGQGILNLPKVDMTYTGETNIWGGTLNFDGTLKNSDLRLNRFAELNSNGGTFKSIKAEYGSVVRPGGKSNIGEMSVDSLVLGFGSRIVLDLDGATTTIDKVNMNKLSIETKNWQYGPKYLTPVIEIVSSNLAEGKYLIGTLASLKGSLANIKIEGQGTFKTALTVEDGNLYLTLGNVRGASNITWTGSKSSTWDYASTENFYLTCDETQTPDVFVAGDIVNFTDESSVNAVTIKDEMTVDTMFVDNSSKTYTFSGTGKLVSGAFVKNGNGKVTISTDNTYTGGTFLNGGTTVVSALSNSTTAYGNLGAVVGTNKKFVMRDGAVLQTTADVKNGSPIRFEGEDGGVINNSSSFVQEKAFAGTLLTKKGNGTLKTSASGVSLTRMIIAAGSVDNTSGYAAKTIEFQGGSLTDEVGTSNTLYVAKGKTGTMYTTNRQSYSNILTGSGKLVMYGALEKGSTYYATRTPLALNLSKFGGTLQAQCGYSADGRFTLNTSTGSDSCTIDIPSGIIVQNSGKSLTLGGVTGAGSLGGSCTFSNSSSAGANTWNVGNANNFSFSGKVVGADVFNKLGEGTMTASGAWETTGAVNIKKGTLKIGAKGQLGTGALTVAAGATLQRTSALITSTTSLALVNSSVTVNGTLLPNMTGTSASGALLFNNQNVTVNASGNVRLGVSKASTSSTTMSGCYLASINKLTINGSIEVFFVNYTPKEGDEIRIWKSVTTFAGNPTVIAEPLADGSTVDFDTSRLSEGVLVVKNVTATSIDKVPSDEEITVDAYTVGGNKVATFTSSMESLDRSLRQEPVPAGTYVLRIKTSEGIFTVKRNKR